MRLLTLLALALLAIPSLAAERPNVIFILTDNHGAWTLGCYGNKEIKTPNIDKIANRGIRFDQAFAVNPVCSPNRATLMTGLIPSQHGVHCFLRGGRLQTGPDARNTIDQFQSLPVILKDAGYACGLVGKWHLGGNMQPQSGLTDYWITKPHGGTGTFYDDSIIHNGKIHKEPTYTTDYWTQHAEKFIRGQVAASTQASDNKPFFLFLSYNGPYALSNLLLREGKNRHTEAYRKEDFLSFPRDKPHVWQYNNKDFQNNPISIRRVAAEVSGVDDGVGRIVEVLEELGIDENTLIVFTGDQGWSGGHGGLFGMGDHTRPLMVTDPMMRVPLIWHHPRRIASGNVSDRLTCNYDFVPTLLSYLDLDHKISERENLPGRDISAELTIANDDASRSESAASKSAPDEAIFFEFENLRSVRTSSWKLVRRFPNGPDELFDLQADPDEQTNRIAERPKIVSDLQAKLDAFFERYATKDYDLWKGGGAQTVIFHPIEEKAKPLPPAEPPALPSDFKPLEFDVPEGYTVELAAGPPLVQHPMMASFDDRGRLFVAESAGLNLRTDDLEKQLPNSIVMLEDTDRDGRFDRRKTFADKMTLPMGAAWHDGALYVASPPNIWRLEDTDDDGVADVRTKLVSEFGYSGNAASVHGCFVSPDGRIFWCDGRHGHEFQDEAGNVTSKGSGSYIFSCRPDGSDLRAHCGGGMDNPVEVDFTATGDVFGTVNILKRPPREDCLVHWLHGGTYPHSERVLGEFRRTGDLLQPVYSFGHVAVSGMTRYRSGALDRNFRDSVFVTIFNTGEVVRSSWQEEGSTFHSQPSPFLKAKTGDCHPTDIVEDADGSLLLVDTGGWFRIGCPTSQIAKPEIAGGIYRIRRKGVTDFSDPWGHRLDWDSPDAASLVKRLYDTRFKVRERAIATCAARGDEIVPLLKGIVERQPYPEGRLNALWSLARINSEKSRPLIRSALGHRFEAMQKAACQVLTNNPDPEAAPQLKQLLESDSPHLRRVAAKALGRSGDASVVPHLIAALARVEDRSEEHAILYAMLELNDAEATAKGLKSEDATIRRGSLIVLSQLAGAPLTPELIRSLLSDEDAGVRKQALEIFKQHPEWAQQAMQWIDERFNASKSFESLLAAFINQEPVARWVSQKLTTTPQQDARFRQILAAIAVSENVSSAELKSAFAKLLVAADSQMLEPLILAAGRCQDKSIDASLRKIAGNSAAQASVRLAAISARSTSKLDDAALTLLTRLIQQDPVLASQAVEIVSQSQLNATQLTALAESTLPRAGAINLSSLLLPYTRSRSPEVGAAMIAALAKSKHASSLAENHLLSVIGGYPPEVHSAAKVVLGRIRKQNTDNKRLLNQWTDNLLAGEASRGREVFFSKKAQCSQCHRIGDDGAMIGPDLSQIGRIRSRRDLLEAILFPSASLAREYESYSVLTVDGQTITGLLLQKGDDDSITLQPAEGKSIKIARDDIDLMKRSPVSLMPGGLHKGLSKDQMADLIGFLKSQR